MREIKKGGTLIKTSRRGDPEKNIFKERAKEKGEKGPFNNFDSLQELWFLRASQWCSTAEVS